MPDAGACLSPPGLGRLAAGRDDAGSARCLRVAQGAGRAAPGLSRLWAEGGRLGAAYDLPGRFRGPRPRAGGARRRRHAASSRATIAFALFQAAAAYALSFLFAWSGRDDRLLFAIGAAAMAASLLIALLRLSREPGAGLPLGAHDRG